MKRQLKAICLVFAVAVLLSSCGLFRPADGQTAPEITHGNTGMPGSQPLQTDGTGTETEEITTDAPAPTATPARVSFVGCGDNIIYYGNVREAAGKAIAGRQYGFAYSYEHVASMISSADISFINQETLMCGDGFDISYYPAFNSPQDLGYDLCELGFDVVNIANNHMLDKGGTGLERTIQFWKQMPVLLIGGYESEADYNTPRYLERDGLTIAFLSYTEHTNGNRIADSYDAWAPYLNKDEVRAQTAEAKANADFVIASVHWGDENNFKPSELEREYAALLAECGVDVILGHHPHVIQPVEWIERADGGRTLCVYSLGNFMAEQDHDYQMVGGIITFDIVRDETGAVSVEDPVFNPTVFHFNSAFYNNQIYLMEDYTAEMAASHGISYYGRHTTLETLKKYVTDTVSAEFLPDFLR